MLNQYSPRALWLVAAVCVLLLSPFFILLFPIAVAETFYFSKDHIVFIKPTINFILTAVAVLIIMMTCVVLAFKRNVFSYSVVGMLVVSAAATLYMGTLSYTAIQKEQVVFKEFQQETIYKWEQMEQLVYEYDIGTVGTYTFTTAGGETLEIEENGQFITEVQQAIYSLAYENDVQFIEREKE